MQEELEMEIVLFKVLISALRCHCLLLEDPVLSEGIIPLWKLLAPVREPLRLCWDLPSPPYGSWRGEVLELPGSLSPGCRSQHR